MKLRLLTVIAILVVIAGLAHAAKVRPVYDRTTDPAGASMTDGRTDFVAEGFELAVPPDGWTLLTSGAAFPWVQSGQNAYEGQFSAYVQWGDIGQFQDEWLITPALDFTGYSVLTLEFWETGNYWASYGGTHEVLVSTTVPDDQAAFTLIEQWTPANYPAEHLDSSGGEWGMLEVDLSAYADAPVVYVALRYTGEYADDWWVDAVRIFEPFEHDVKAVAVVPDGEIFADDSAVAPAFTVKNVGQNTETFDARLEVHANGELLSMQTHTVADLAPGDEAVLGYDAFNTVAGTVYELVGTTLLDGDLDPGNDSYTAVNECYSAQRTPLGLLVTNWGCGPCVQANQALDAYVPDQGNEVALIRVHAWWPSSNDPMYLANTEQCDFLITGTPTGADYAPHLWLDNVVDAGSDGAGYANFFEVRKTVPAPLTVPILQYLPVEGQLVVTLDVVDPMPASGDYRLFVAVTEDAVAAQGPNGEPIHNQAFRWLYPGLDGLPISTDVGIAQYVVDLALDPAWAFDNLRGTVYVQDVISRRVMNAGTIFLNEGTVAIEDDDQPAELPQAVTTLRGAQPNPFNPQTAIAFSVARTQAVELAVYDMAGRRVTVLADGVVTAGEHRVVWQGRDDAGQAMPSGTYMLKLTTEESVRTSKMMLVR
jgi:hypothetical protein